MSFHRPIQLGVLLIALVVSGSVALAQEQGQQGPTKQPIGHGMSNDQMQMMHQQMVPGSQTLARYHNPWPLWPWHRDS